MNHGQAAEELISSLDGEPRTDFERHLGSREYMAEVNGNRLEFLKKELLLLLEDNDVALEG